MWTGINSIDNLVEDNNWPLELKQDLRVLWEEFDKFRNEGMSDRLINELMKSKQSWNWETVKYWDWALDSILTQELSDYNLPKWEVLSSNKNLNTNDIWSSVVNKKIIDELWFTFKPSYFVISWAIAKYGLWLDGNVLKSIAKLFKFQSEDKAKHMIASTAIYAAFRSMWQDIPEAMIETFVVGVLKEVYDKVSGTWNPELKDMSANTLGILIWGAVDKFLLQSEFASKVLNSGVKIDFWYYDAKWNFNLGLNLWWEF